MEHFATTPLNVGMIDGRSATRPAEHFGRYHAIVGLPVGVFEAVARLARLRSIELGRTVEPEELMEAAITEYMTIAGFVDQSL